MILIQDIRTDYPEFADQSTFPDQQLTYWLSIAYLLINQDRFGPPAPFAETKAVLVGAGSGYALNDLLTVQGGANTQPAVIRVDGVGGSGAITASTVTNTGLYTIVPANPVATIDSGTGTGATFNLTWKSQPHTVCDLALELFTCHNLFLERRAITEAQNGANPGAAQGLISSKGVGPVNISYDTATAALAGMGDFNLSIYGQRLAKLIRMFGMGPITLVGDFFGGGFAQTGASWPGLSAVSSGIVWDG